MRIQAGDCRAWALWSPDSPIALRVYSTHQAPDATWVDARVREALDLRKLTLDADTTAYRLLFGEGDGLPGVTADRYGDHIVILSYAPGLEQVVEWACASLLQQLAPRSIVHKPAGSSEGATQVLHGKKPPNEIVVTENGLRFRVELGKAQKSGLFLDHRDNRAFVARLARNARVLNLFSYTGAFSVYAAAAGARQVTTVDVAPGVVDAARENFKLNGLDPNAHHFEVADVFAWVDAARERNGNFDLVICDPPSLARRKEQRVQALKAYRKLNTAVMRLVTPGGLLATASCTAQVDVSAFQRTVAEAATRARRRFQILRDAAHAADHPVMAHHPEGRYLKFLLGRVIQLP